MKQFGNEPLEKSRYQVILDNLVKSAMNVQYSLSRLNIGQQTIFNAGMALNLAMAVFDVSRGKLTPGDFVMV